MDRLTAVEVLTRHRPTRWWLPPWPRRCRTCRQRWRCDTATLAHATLYPPMPPWEPGGEWRRGGPQ